MAERQNGWGQKLRRHWQAWRARRTALRTLRSLSNDRLEDIGLTRRDVDRLR